MDNRLENYLALLAIRRAGRQRDTVILGAIFSLSMIAMLVFGLLGSLTGRSVYWVAGLVATSGISFLMVWVQLKTIEQSIELVNQIKNFDNNR